MYSLTDVPASPGWTAWLGKGFVGDNVDILCNDCDSDSDFNFKGKCDRETKECECNKADDGINVSSPINYVLICCRLTND